MLVLAITLILMGVFFFYVRQKLFIIESRLELMSETIQTMAGVTRAALQDDSEDESEESDESRSDSDEDSEPDHVNLVFEDQHYPTPERVTVSDDDVKKISLPGNEAVEEIEVKKMTLSDTYDLDEVKTDSLTNEVVDLNVSDSPELDKRVTSFESLTLKELKDKVAEYNGPKLKTKKELIDFLQNKI
jgi:cytoskeletal protein RodZ